MVYYVLIEMFESTNAYSFKVLGVYDSIGKAKMAAYKYVIDTDKDYQEWEEVPCFEDQLFKLEKRKKDNRRIVDALYIEGH